MIPGVEILSPNVIVVAFAHIVCIKEPLSMSRMTRNGEEMMKYGLRLTTTAFLVGLLRSNE